MLFYNFYLTKIGSRIQIELKNSIKISGKLISVDPFLNFKLTDIDQCTSKDGLAIGLGKLKDCYIRGSSVKFARVPLIQSDIQKLETASRFRACKLDKK